MHCKNAKTSTAAKNKYLYFYVDVSAQALYIEGRDSVSHIDWLGLAKSR